MREMRPDDPLGHLVPPGSLSPPVVQRAIVAAMDRSALGAGQVRVAPSRYTVRMEPGDRAWLRAGLEDQLAKTLEIYAGSAGYLTSGPIQVEFSPARGMMRGAIAVEPAFAEEDLPLLADADDALRVFAAGMR